VVWQLYDGNDNEIYLWQGGSPTPITDNSTDDARAAISGSNVVWQHYDGNDYEIYLWQGGSPTPITDNSTDDARAAISGSNVTWQNDDGGDYEVYLWEQGSTTSITDNDIDDGWPSISGSNVAWRRGEGEDYEIYLARGVGPLSICGNGAVEGVEECDDGGTADGDDCSAVCEIEDRVELYGQAQGGRVEVTIDQVTVGVDTTPGQTAEDVIAALAAAVNGNPTLAALGTTALAIGNALVTNGAVNHVTNTDPGLSGFPVPALHPTLQIAFALLLMAVGLMALRRRSP
jgi:cysteine-rich repeat protein